MNEKLLNDLLLSAIRNGEVSLELSDTLVDSFLEQPLGERFAASTASVQWKLKVRQQDAAIAAARCQVSDTPQPFGRFVEAVRERAGLTRIAIAERLQKAEDYVQRLERGDLSPINVPAPDLANVLGLFNVHISSVPQMIMASLTAATDKATYRAAARSHGGIRREARGEDVERALDAFAVHMRQKALRQASANIRSDVQAYVGKVREELARAGRLDLLV
jgi:transcriptional regulator with XRE-family HTH domain